MKKSVSHPLLSFIVPISSQPGVFEAELLYLKQFQKSELIAYSSAPLRVPEFSSMMTAYGLKIVLSPTIKQAEWQLLNRAAAKATGEWVVFCRSQALPAVEGQSALLHAVGESQAAAISMVDSKIVPHFLWQRIKQWQSPLIGLIFGTELIAIKRTVFLKEGGFHHALSPSYYARFLETIDQQQGLRFLRVPIYRVESPSYLASVRRWIAMPTQLARYALSHWKYPSPYPLPQGERGMKMH